MHYKHVKIAVIKPIKTDIKFLNKKKHHNSVMPF